MAEQRPEVFVHGLPALVPSGALRGAVAVVVDVLRATTVMVHALEAGAKAVVPCLEIDDAVRVARELPEGSAILGGERGGLPIDGFDLGNSPASYSPEVCRGKTVVMTTTNGTKAILASLEAERVFVAGFVNLTATVHALRSAMVDSSQRSVHIVCAGTEGHVSLEDSLLAGALAARIADVKTPEQLAAPVSPLGNDEAILAVADWLEVERSLEKDKQALARWLSLGRGGRNVRRIGLEPDIRDAARVDRFDLVAELKRDPLRIVAGA